MGWYSGSMPVVVRKDPRVSGVLGVFLVFLRWGLDLMGITVNVWLGAAVLLAALSFLCYALWIWKPWNRWRRSAELKDGGANKTPVDPQLIIAYDQSAIYTGLYVRNLGPSQDAFRAKIRPVKGISYVLESEKIERIRKDATAPLIVRSVRADGGGSPVLGMFGAPEMFLGELAEAEGVAGIKGTKFSVELEYYDASDQCYVNRSDMIWKRTNNSFSVERMKIFKSSSA